MCILLVPAIFLSTLNAVAYGGNTKSWQGRFSSRELIRCMEYERGKDSIVWCCYNIVFSKNIYNRHHSTRFEGVSEILKLLCPASDSYQTSKGTHQLLNNCVSEMHFHISNW